ncbi:MAG TPA: MBL fold metallo-hydrolase [Chthoniobacterales bacterium]|nr:MBL fold metallo-hydrolase [Chthoniobacterales bacterium]
MKFTNLTRRTEIGANSYYLEVAGHRLALDSGMHPKCQGEEALPNMNALGGQKLDAIIISHSHQDHIGTLPVLMRRQPQARVFMTEPTAEIGSILLHNSVNVMTRQREELGTTLYPLFTHREIDRRSEGWQSCALRQPYTLAGERAPPDSTETTFEFFEAGHVLGSTGVLLRTEGRKVFYTGDVNFDDQTIAQAAIFPEEKIDVLIMECTRGDTPVPPTWSRAAEEKRLMQAIENAFTRGGCVLIPVFALGKTQEVLAMLYKLRREKILDFPIYIGGLSSKISEIYDRRAQLGRRQLPRLQLLDELRPFVLNAENIHDAGARPGRVYALSSGMMTPKTLSNIFAQRIVDQPRHSIFFVGYADPESPAGILRNARPNAQVTIDPDRAPQTVRCHMEQFQFSAHASRESLVAFAERLAPKKIVLVHGDPLAVEWIRTRLSVNLPNSEIIVPTPGIELEL